MYQYTRSKRLLRINDPDVRKKAVKLNMDNNTNVSVGDCVLCGDPLLLTVNICAEGCSGSTICTDCLRLWKSTSMYRLSYDKFAPTEQYMTTILENQRCVGCRGDLDIHLHSADYYRMLEEASGIHKFDCDKCQESITSLRARIVHDRDVHSSLNSIACPRCNKDILETPASFQHHIMHECTNLRCFRRFCHVTGLDASEMKEHLLKHDVLGTMVTRTVVHASSTIAFLLRVYETGDAHSPMYMDRVYEACLGLQPALEDINPEATLSLNIVTLSPEMLRFRAQSALGMAEARGGLETVDDSDTDNDVADVVPGTPEV